MSTRRGLYELGLDDTPGTYLTDYVITALSWSFCVVLLIRNYGDKRKFSIYKRRDHALLLYFITFGISYLCGGITHHFYPHTNEYPNTPNGFYIFWIPTLIFFQFSQFFLSVLIGPITECICCEITTPEKKIWSIYRVIISILSLGFVSWAVYIYSVMPIGIYSVIISFYFLIQSLLRIVKANCKCSLLISEWLYILYCLLWSVSSLLTQIIFASGCQYNDLGYYSNNPNDKNYCPFIIEFNHNAWFHVAIIGAVICLFFGVIYEDITRYETKQANKAKKRSKEDWVQAKHEKVQTEVNVNIERDATFCI